MNCIPYIVGYSDRPSYDGYAAREGKKFTHDREKVLNHNDDILLQLNVIVHHRCRVPPIETELILPLMKGKS